MEKIENKNAQAEYYLTDIVNIAASLGEKIQSLMIEPQEAMGINSKEDLKLAENLL